ncbi:hypothetical protein L9F63_025493, partial [Diploptera punctata]
DSCFHDIAISNIHESYEEELNFYESLRPANNTLNSLQQGFKLCRKKPLGKSRLFGLLIALELSVCIKIEHSRCRLWLF